MEIKSLLEKLFAKHDYRKIAGGLATVICIVVLLFQYANPSLYERLSESAFDILYNGENDSNISENDILILGLDRRTFAETKLTFSRFFPQYEKIVKRLTKAKARAIAFDISITTAPDTDSAKRFVEAIEAGPPFIMATQLPPKEKATPSMPETKEAQAIIQSSKIYTGYVDLIGSPNNGGVIRKLALEYERNDKKYSSFALTIARQATRSNGSKTDKADKTDKIGEIEKYTNNLENGLYRIPFASEKGGIPYISCADLLAKDRLPDGVFKDKIVIFGPIEEWFHDFHLTPVGVTAGVQIHGNVVRGLLKNKHIRPLNSLYTSILIIIFAIAAFFAGKNSNTGVRIFLFIVIEGIILWICTYCGIKGIWLSPLPLIIVSTTALLVPTIVKTLNEALEAARIQKLFGQFVSKEVFQAILRSKDGLNLSGSEMESTILFSDIRGFTTMSEKEGAEETFSILNEYLAEMVEVIFKNGGRLDKFIGDAIMAVYGAPFARKDDPLRAVQTAFEMKQRLGSLNKRLSAQGRKELKIGIGLCTGKLYAGVLGTSEKMEYAVIGDTVNTASRLEHMTKDEGVTILMSQSTYEKVKDHVEVIELGDREVRGRNQKLKVYGLMDMK